MTDQQKQELRQQAANFKAAIESAVPTAKNANVSLNFDALQVSIQIGSLDSSLNTQTAVESMTMVCKFENLPPAA